MRISRRSSPPSPSFFDESSLEASESQSLGRTLFDHAGDVDVYGIARPAGAAADGKRMGWYRPVADAYGAHG